MKTILVVDSDPMTLHILVGMLKSHTNLFKVLFADSIHVAIDMLNQESVDLLITGMHIPEPDTFHLALLLAGVPDLRVIILTNNTSEQFCNKIKTLPSIIHFDQILDIRLLVKRIFAALQIDYGGQLQGFSLSSLLQMLEVEGRSCTLLVTAKSKTGTIHLKDGKPIAARVDKLTGKAAALLILNWQNALVDIDYNPREVPVELKVSLMNLLLESGQYMDETLSQRQNHRRHNRYDCLVGVEYLVDDVTYQCYMHDLSEGGAYLETDQAIESGQEIILELYSPLLEASCAVKGVVVRRDTTGVGVQFGELSVADKKVIQTIIESCCQPIPTSVN